MLAMLVRVIQTERMAEFMDKDTTNIADSPATGIVAQRPPIGIELLIFVKQNVGFDNRPVHRPIVGDGKGSSSKFLSENRSREDYRVDLVTGRSGSAGDVALVGQPSHGIIPGAECGGCGGIPGCVSINQSTSR